MTQTPGELSAEALEFQLPSTPELTEPPGSPDLYTPETLSGMLGLAEIELSEEWQSNLLATLNDLQPAVNRLRSLDLGETPPATAFDPRWS